jgi:hypothetical protein
MKLLVSNLNGIRRYFQFREDTSFFNGDHYAAGADDAPTENVFEVQALSKRS